MKRANYGPVMNEIGLQYIQCSVYGRNKDIEYVTCKMCKGRFPKVRVGCT